MSRIRRTTTTLLNATSVTCGAPATATREIGKVLVFLTYQFSLPALTICVLYKCRWQVYWVLAIGTYRNPPNRALCITILPSNKVRSR
jgi:hypothetical protein